MDLGMARSRGLGSWEIQLGSWEKQLGAGELGGAAGWEEQLGKLGGAVPGQAGCGLTSSRVVHANGFQQLHMTECFPVQIYVGESFALRR